MTSMHALDDVSTRGDASPDLPLPCPGTPLEPTSDAVCVQCDGAGFYKAAVPFGHPSFGVLFPCDCTLRVAERAATEVRRRASNLGDVRALTFAAFDPFVPGVQAAYRRAVAYARRPQGWLILFGTYGSGKTHLAAAIANAVLERGGAVRFEVVPDLLDHLRATYAPDSALSYDARFETVRSVPLLVLDDLGTENPTPWAREKLYQIVNARYNAQLPTVITSNVKPELIDPRIASRMSDCALCEEPIQLTAADYRPRRMRLSAPAAAGTTVSEGMLSAGPSKGD